MIPLLINLIRKFYHSMTIINFIDIHCAILFINNLCWNYIKPGSFRFIRHMIRIIEDMTTSYFCISLTTLFSRSRPCICSMLHCVFQLTILYLIYFKLLTLVNAILVQRRVLLFLYVIHICKFCGCHYAFICLQFNCIYFSPFITFPCFKLIRYQYWHKLEKY